MTALLAPEFEVIPSCWEVKRLGELIEPGRKISYGIVQPGFHDDLGIPIIRVNNIKNNRIVADGVLKVAAEIESQYKRTRIRGGELLVTLVGSLGEVAIADDKYIGWNLARAVGVIPIASRSEAEWVKFYLTSRIAKYFIGMWANTTVQHTLNLKDLAQLPIPMPPDGEREQLVEFIGSLDEKIEFNRKQNRTLEAIAQALFKHWFVDFEFPDENGNPYKSSGGAMQPSELGEIPDNWRIASIEDLSDKVAMGPFGSNIKVSTFVDAGVPVISGQHLNETLLEDTTYNFITEDHAEKLSNSVVGRGDIVFTHAGNIGQVSLIPQNSAYDKYVLSQRQFYLRSNTELTSPIYLVYFFRSRLGQHKLLANASQVGVPSIARPSSYLKSIQVVAPNKEILDRFDAVVAQLLERTSLNRSQIVTLSKLRDTLLPKLMSGELRVA